MSPRIGRPKVENPKTFSTRIRLSEDDVKILKFCQEKTGKTKSDIIREGIRKVYESIKK